MATTKKYRKESILRAAAFQRYKDFLSFALDAEKEYSIAMVEKIIKEFKEREVK